jgi:hypothetical protein
MCRAGSGTFKLTPSKRSLTVSPHSPTGLLGVSGILSVSQHSLVLLIPLDLHLFLAAQANLGFNRFERSWGPIFSTFEQFLSFGWPCVVVTDQRTGRAHIVTRTSNINAFARMVKTRCVFFTQATFVIAFVNRFHPGLEKYFQTLRTLYADAIP